MSDTGTSNQSKTVDLQVHPAADLVSNSSVARPIGVKGHKTDCLCLSCARIKKARAEGRPTKAELAEASRQRRLAREKAKEEKLRTKKSLRVIEKQAKAKVLEGVVAGQIALGKVPSAAAAAEIAGVTVQKAKDLVGSDFVQTALAKAGITDDKLAAVAAEGLDAKNFKLMFDDEGNVVDNIEFPDHQNRHRFWRDLLLAKGVLGEKDERGGSGGGLIIIAPQEAKVIEGHAPACVCEKCVDAWNIKTRVLSRRAANAMAIDADLVENKRALPESLPPDPFEDDDEN